MNISIITGGGSGLGLEISKLLNKNGMNILMISRSETKLKEAKKILLNHNALIEYFVCDIGHEEDVNQLYNYIINRGYTIDYLFNVAGTGMYNALNDISYDKIIGVFNSNLIGLMLMCKTFSSNFRENENGTRIINVLSTAALKGKKMESIYYAAKWGARGFTESMKDEIQETKTEIITVYPGGMKTPFWDNSTSGYNTDKFMDPADVAEVITNIALNKKVYISDITINRPK